MFSCDNSTSQRYKAFHIYKWKHLLWTSESIATMPKNAIFSPESADFIDQLFIDIVTNGIHVRVQWITQGGRVIFEMLCRYMIGWMAGVKRESSALLNFVVSCAGLRFLALGASGIKSINRCAAQCRYTPLSVVWRHAASHNGEMFLNPSLFLYLLIDCIALLPVNTTEWSLTSDSMYKKR